LLRAVTTIFFPIRLLLDSNIDSTSLQLEACNKKKNKNKINLFTYFNNTDDIDVQKHDQNKNNFKNISYDIELRLQLGKY